MILTALSMPAKTLMKMNKNIIQLTETGTDLKLNKTEVNKTGKEFWKKTKLAIRATLRHCKDNFKKL